MSNVSKELEQILLADCERTFLTRKQRQVVRKAMNTIETLSKQVSNASWEADARREQDEIARAKEWR